MSRYTVEKDWTTAAGFRAVVLMTGNGHRCGYVGVDSDHPLHGKDYSDNCDFLSYPASETIGKRGVMSLLCATEDSTSPDVVFDVHGSLTYAGGNSDYPVESNLWWFGFDCAHAGDAASPEHYAKQRETYPDSPFMWRACAGDIHRDLEFCVDECESLAQQFVDRVALKAAP